MNGNTTPTSDIYDLVIIGGSAAGLSVAISSLKSGLTRIRIIEADSAVAFPELVGPNQLDVGFGEHVQRIDIDTADVDTARQLVVETDRLTYRTQAVLVADRRNDDTWKPTIEVPNSDRVVIGDQEIPADDSDICIVGATDHAVELAVRYAASGYNVVLAARGMDPAKLSPAGASLLRRVERDRRATVLYRSAPASVTLFGGYPLVDFGDRRTPDLQFDRVVFAPPRLVETPADLSVTEAAMVTERVWFVGAPAEGLPSTVAPGNEIGVRIAKACFPDLDISQLPSPREERGRHSGAIEELRDEHYNATITMFEPHHSDLWVLRVKPDTGSTSFAPGQYASLGLGHWEERIDDALDPDAEQRWDKLVRRSYSISSRIFDDHGYLADDTTAGELEFYIVLVKPSADNIPGLTPRLALKKPGDRIYLGPKVAGRYTTSAVTNPHAELVFLSTGTGEAPHNPMIVELLSKGHVGPIISAVTVRQQSDLGYLDKHRQLAERYPNYHYLPMPTREPGVPKRYLQDLIRDDDFAHLGVALTPETSHVFLCGNPAMIGLPEDDENGNPVYPEPTGVVELLEERGFKLDRRRDPGNIHYEEYW